MAEEDLEGIYEYSITRWGIKQFEIYRQKINTALETIAEDPMILGSRARDDLFPGCRMFRIEQHYLIYRISGELVEVGRVLHKKMNFELQTSDPDIFD